jgi:hypothetical protein
MAYCIHTSIIGISISAACPGWRRYYVTTPSVNIVITSSWRESFDLNELRQFFCEEIAPRIIGVTTCIDDRKPFRRYRENSAVF